MTSSPRSVLRRAIAALLMLTLALAGAGRGFAADEVAGAAPGLSVPGILVPICHAGGGSPPADPIRHDCCDACALLAAATLADAPSLAAPLSAARPVTHGPIAAWVPSLARRRTPRQSQGPPAA